MRIIGITGPIGSGKSTVTQILVKSYAAMVINADEISRKVVAKGEAAFREVVDCFGDGVLDGQGELDRKKLADIVFEDSKKLGLLNNITHKYIVDIILEEIRKKRAEGAEILGLECIIPVKHGFMDVAGEVWVVTADRETRIKRIMSRSGLGFKEAVDRINSQMNEEEYIKLADKVICNNSGIVELEGKVKELIKY